MSTVKTIPRKHINFDFDIHQKLNQSFENINNLP